MREKNMDMNQKRDIEKLHRESVIFDGLLMWGNLDSRKTLGEMIEGNLGGGNYTVANHSHDFRGAIVNILKYRKVIEENSDLVALALNTENIKKAQKSRKVGIVFGFQDTRAVEEVDQLEVFYALGVRIIQLTYNAQNLAGTGCCEISGGKITYYGQNLIRKIEELKIALDLSHCGDETTESALEFAERPVLFTHVGVRQLCNAYGRCKTDKQLEKVARTGGMAGVCFAPYFVKRDPQTFDVLPSSVKDVVDAIQYLVKLIGVDHVGFGSDLARIWFDLGKTPSDSSMRLWRTLRPDVFGRGPTETYDPFPVGLQKHSELINLTAELANRGFSDKDIQKILGGNFLRVLSRIWGE
jgi:membrane dipeptidase